MGFNKNQHIQLKKLGGRLKSIRLSRGLTLKELKSQTISYNFCGVYKTMNELTMKKTLKWISE